MPIEHVMVFFTTEDQTIHIDFFILKGIFVLPESRALRTSRCRDSVGWY